MVIYKLHFIESLARGGRRIGHIFSSLEEERLQFARRHGVVGTVPVTLALLGATAGVAAVQIIPPVVQPLGGNLVSEIIESDARKQGTGLYDAKGRFVGLLPGSKASDPSYNPTGKPEIGEDELGRRFTVYPDHKTLFVESPPPLYLACLKRLEDSQLGNPLINPHGVDAIGLTRPIISLNKAGGSGLSAQLVQSMIRPKEGINKYQRKLEETFWTVPLMYGHAPNDKRFDQYLARHMPHLQYMQDQQGTIWGIEAAGQILFGKTASALSPVEQFILAGSTKQPIIFPVAFRNNTNRILDKSKVSRETWDLALGPKRAGVCAQDPDILPNEADRKATLAALRELRKSLPIPKGDPTIMQLGEMRYGYRWPERARNPFWRANIFSYNATRALPLEFREGLGPSWSRKVAKVRLSFDIADERRFTPAFRAAVRGWLVARDDLNPYYRKWATYAPGEQEPVETMPEVILGVTDSEGRLVRYYSSSEAQPYFGSKRTKDGQYQPLEEDRQLASVAKVAGALVLLKANKADSRARRAMALSRSDDLEILLNEADPDGKLSREMVERLRWSNASAEGATIQHNIVEGYLSASPRTVQWGALAITNALAGDYALVRPPSLIGSVTLVDLTKGKLDIPRGFLPSSYGQNGGKAILDPKSLLDPEKRQSARLLLSAPICDRGTLRKLRNWCPQSGRTRFIWGKTGTMDITAFTAGKKGTGTGTVIRISIAGGVEFNDGRRFSFFLSMGGNDYSHPLTIANGRGSGLNADKLVPLLNRVLTDLESANRAPIKEKLS